MAAPRMGSVSDTLTDPMLGRVIDGRYEVRERVAGGGMATVYLAFDRRLERDVALKVMHRHLEVDPNSQEFVTRFRREAKSAARLTHPGVVRVYDQGVDQDVSYLTMEFVEGENLRQRMAREGTLTLGEALGTLEQVLDAIASAHRHGLVHQDIKPENVLIDMDGRPRVVDFGLARAVTEVSSSTNGTILGTVAYLGPELITSGVSDARTDVYAAGVLLYEMITGRQPHTGTTAIEIATKHVHAQMPAPSETVPWLPPEVDDLIRDLTARDPAKRPEDAAAALTLVRATVALIDEPTLARRADPPSGTHRIVTDPDATAVIHEPAPGSTVALPIGLGTHGFPAVHADLDTLPEDDPEAREPQRGGNRALWWVAAVLVALLALGGGTFWWYQSIGPGAYTTVPPVATETEEAARTLLEGVGLVPQVEPVFDYDIPAGIVVASEPGAQQRVLNGSEVTLEVSQGPPMATVPALVGSQREDAVRALEEAGLPVGEITETSSDTVPAGEVMEASQQEGVSIRDDTPVDLVVSSGPAPIEFPDVTDMTEEDAIALLEDEYGLVVSVNTERTDKADKGIVFAQSPEPGAAGNRLDAITITVSDGPPLVAVDDYVGMDYDEGVRAAREAGLKVSTSGRWGFLSDKNTIVDQSITPGTQVERGTDIVLIYN